MAEELTALERTTAQLEGANGEALRLSTDCLELYRDLCNEYKQQILLLKKIISAQESVIAELRRRTA